MSMHQEKDQEASIRIHIATTLREKREVYRLRYRIYVDEMSMQLTSANHTKKYVCDELDERGILLYAKAGSEIIGTMRLNIGNISNFPPHLVDILSLERFNRIVKDKNSRIFSYGSKLMVAPHYRNSLALYLLMSKAYEIYYDQRVQFNLGVCNSHLLQLYEHFGYRRFGSSITAPGYDGVLYPIVLVVEDLKHLRTVRSPFYRFARRRGTATSDYAADFFLREFPEYNDRLNSQLTSEVDFWNSLCKKLGRTPTTTMPLLRGLSASEASKFLHNCGVIVQYHPGDQVITLGSKSYTINILLSGRLATAFPGIYRKGILPGQNFGVSGLDEQPLYTEDIIAATDSEVLILSRLSFQKFRHSNQSVSSNILHNLRNYVQHS